MKNTQEISAEIILAIKEEVEKEVVRAENTYAKILYQQMLQGILTFAAIGTMTYFAHLLLSK